MRDFAGEERSMRKFVQDQRLWNIFRRIRDKTLRAKLKRTNGVTDIHVYMHVRVNIYSLLRFFFFLVRLRD